MDSATTTNDTIAQHWECVVKAATEVFESTCGTQLTLLAEPVAANEKLILAVIALVGEVEWSLFLGLPGPTATAVAAKFAGFDIPFDSPDMGDAIGEVTNILAGRLKALLDKRGVRADISLPTVMRADGLEVLVQRQSASAKACFDSPIGRLWTGVLAGKTPGVVL